MRRRILDASGNWVWSRRQVLRGGLAAASLVAACRKPMTGRGDDPLGGGNSPGDPKLPPETPDPMIAEPGVVHPPAYPIPHWVRDARIAGLDASLDPEELEPALDAFKAHGVNVVELDSKLSFYLNDTDFDDQVFLLDEAAKGCHARGMRAVIYYPTLEVLTPNAANNPSMAKDHPDWMQIDLRGMPNKFIGGEGRVFWVEKGTESAWLCPNGPYGDLFIDRVKQLAKTALDGLWGDVPLFADIVAQWPCICANCKAKFKSETGLDSPTKVDFDNPGFRRWVVWRHKQIHEFEQRLTRDVKAVRDSFEIIIETVTMDYSSGTVQGLDGASHDDDRVLRMWEVDVVSDKMAMRHASAEDWLDTAVMMKFGAGCSAPRPSWVFCYGDQTDDAEYVFGLALATGNNPFELKVPIMTSSVGHDYRTRVFQWLASEPALYAAYPLHKVAVLYSSPSRDFLDRAAVTGLYSTQNAADPLWWSNQPTDSVGNLQYVGDYRGWCRALIHAHMPYDILPASRASAETLARYKVLVVPSAVALSDATMGVLREFARAGGTLVTSGPDLGRYDEDGGDRGNPALMGALGVPPTAAWAKMPLAKGFVVAGADRAGWQYLRGENPRARSELLAMAITDPQVVSDAPPATVMSLRRTRDAKLLLVVSNLDGLGAQGRAFTPKDSSFKVAVALDGKTATGVTSSRPGDGRKKIDFVMKDGRVEFTLDVHAVAVAVIDLAV